MNTAQTTRAELQAGLFRNSLPMRMTLQEIVRGLNVRRTDRCMAIGRHAAMFAYHLRKLGGNWATVVASEEEAVLARELVGDDVHILAEEVSLPFKDKTFDAVVVVDCLEKADRDEAFVEDCHRVLKNDGRLVVNVAHRKSMTLVNPLRRLLGGLRANGGTAGIGYSEPEMFGILKHGFDVSNMRTYMRFFVVLVDTFVQAAVGHATSEEGLKRAARRYSIAAPFYWLGYQMDLFLFMTRGFSMICAAKRRAWLPRKTPVLSDGRSISEAVLSRAVD